MQAQAQMETETHVQNSEVDTISRWNLLKRIAFRFTLTYFVLYSFPFPLPFLPWVGDFISEKYSVVWDSIVPWAGKHILGIDYDILVAATGSGDKTYDWVQVFCFLVLAATATAIWSVLDRRRANYERLHQWFTLYMRFVLASWMIIYGTIKAIPVQMPEPHLTRLVEQYGDFSPMGVLWYFMGSSPVYTSITGSIELLGGILLIFPRTALPGAIVSFITMTQVFILNMCYDVPVKLFSFHLILMLVVLLAPHLNRLMNVLVLNRPTEPAIVRPWFERRWLNRSMLIFQIVFGLYLVGFYFYSSYEAYNTYGGGAPKPPLYGIWTVEDFTVNGEVRPPLITDETRWNRVIFQFQNSLIVQPMRGTNQPYQLRLDTENKTMSLAKAGDQEWKASFNFEEPEQGQMRLSGDINGQPTEARLIRMDENQFLLRSRGFNWIQERPFNR